jgi:hypothetical protein
MPLLELLELTVFLSRLVHLSGLISLVLVYMFSYRNYKTSLTISKLSMIPLMLLIISFFVVLARPTEIPGIWFVVILNTLYGAAWWLSIRKHVYIAIFR